MDRTGLVRLEMYWIRLTLRVPPLHLIELLGRNLRQVPALFVLTLIYLFSAI